MILKIKYRDLGLIGYSEALAIQEETFKSYLDRKRNTDMVDFEFDGHVFLCEHKHVITLGKSGAIENLLLNNEQLKQKGVEFFHSSRGGDITYHGPGQIVGYPVLDLDRFGLTVKAYVNLLEELIIETLKEYHLAAGRIFGMTGVWLDYDNLRYARKICAMGVKVSRWVSMHGFAFNIQTDLSYFNSIVPCGIKEKAVTSLSKELGVEVSLAEVKEKLIANFSRLFDVNITRV